MNTYNEESLNSAIQLLLLKPCTIKDMSKKFGKSHRTIKRWLEEMRTRGHRVVREGVTVESPYSIIST